MLAAAAGAAPPAATALPAPPPLPRQPQTEEQVHVMLCLVHATLQPSAEERAQAVAEAAVAAAAAEAALAAQRSSAACLIQAAARGWWARRRLRVQHLAACLIQAHARGMLARRAAAAARLRQQRRSDSELGPAERLALRQQVAERLYMERAARSQSKGGGRQRSAVTGNARQANTAPEAAARKRSLAAGTIGSAAAAVAVVRGRGAGHRLSVAGSTPHGGGGSGLSGSTSGAAGGRGSQGGPRTAAAGPSS